MSGQALKIDVRHEDGALVAGYIAKNAEYNAAANGKAGNGSRVRGGVRRQKPRSAIKLSRETFHHLCNTREKRFDGG